MEKPDTPLPPAKYTVTGGRETVAELIVHTQDQDGDQRWELSSGAKLYDVTHLPCRSARYTPQKSADISDDSCSPANMPQNFFPVAPGGVMPSLKGCNKQDYAVLFVMRRAEL